MKILVNSGEFSLFSMSKCDICQLEVHDVEGYLLYYQLLSGRLVESKKSHVALSDAVSTNVGFFARLGLNEFRVPEEMDQAFRVLFTESTYVC